MSSTVNMVPDTAAAQTRSSGTGGGPASCGAGSPGGVERRYERKFFLDETVSAEEAAALLKLHPRLIRNSYPDRFINNIYLDSHALGCYQANAAGISPRMKYRLRWYGPLGQDAAGLVLEIKRKFNLVGDKIRIPLGEFDTNQVITQDLVSQLLGKMVRDRARPVELTSLRCILANRYRRSYFESADHIFRVTIDQVVEYFPFRFNRLDQFHLVRDSAVIVEVKYAEDHDITAQGLTNHFPIRVCRHSKYVRGVNLLRQNYLF